MPFKHILNEEFIEVPTSVPETIQCLREQSGASRHTVTSDDMRIFFECSKKGEINVETNIVGYLSRDMNMFPIYHTKGEVVCVDSKTYIRIVSFYKKSDLLWRYLALVFIFLTIPILTFNALLNEILNLGVFVSILISCVVGAALSVSHTENRKRTGRDRIAVMESEIRTRVQNITLWYD